MVKKSVLFMSVCALNVTFGMGVKAMNQEEGGAPRQRQLRLDECWPSPDVKKIIEARVLKQQELNTMTAQQKAEKECRNREWRNWYIKIGK